MKNYLDNLAFMFAAVGIVSLIISSTWVFTHFAVNILSQMFANQHYFYQDDFKGIIGLFSVLGFFFLFWMPIIMTITTNKNS
jgi:hypothetical protein